MSGLEPLCIKVTAICSSVGLFILPIFVDISGLLGAISSNLAKISTWTKRLMGRTLTVTGQSQVSVTAMTPLLIC